MDAETPDTGFAVFGAEGIEEGGWVGEEVGVGDEGELGAGGEGGGDATTENGDVCYCGSFETLAEDFGAY